MLLHFAGAPSPRHQGDSQRKDGDQIQKMVANPQDQLKQVVEVIGLLQCIPGDGDRLAPIEGLQSWHESLAYAAFEIVHTDEMGRSGWNLLGRYAFSVPEAVQRGELRPLWSPSDCTEEVA
jgi:hypothetical protein